MTTLLIFAFMAVLPVCGGLLYRAGKTTGRRQMLEAFRGKQVEIVASPKQIEDMKKAMEGPAEVVTFKNSRDAGIDSSHRMTSSDPYAEYRMTNASKIPQPGEAYLHLGGV